MKAHPEGPSEGWLDDSRSSRLQFSAQLIDLVAVEPERHSQSRLWHIIQIHVCLTERKGDRAGIKDNNIGSIEACIDR